MFSDENSSDFVALKNEFQTRGSISTKLLSKSIEHNQINIISESETSVEATRSYNFRLSRSKYANLIDQSDIKWWTDIQTKKLAAGKDDLKQYTSTVAADTKPKEKAAISHLSNAPICCPIMDCNIFFLPNDMLLHFLSYHKQSAPMRQVYEKQHLLIKLTPFELNIDEVTCVGLVSYAGKKLTSCVPTANDLWMPQSVKLCKHFSYLMHDYPIFMLASIVSMDVFMRPKAEIEEFDYNNICASMFVLWLAATQSNANIFCTITAFNDQLSNSQSGIYNVRTLDEQQCPYKFCNKDCNYFRLTFKELYSLLRDEKTLQIELVFQESLENNEQ